MPAKPGNVREFISRPQDVDTVWEKNLVNENCLVLASCLGLHQCLVDWCKSYIAYFKDFDAYYIITNIFVEYALIMYS